MTDKDRLDWLDKLDYFTFTERKESHTSSPFFGAVIQRTLFTIPSQHINGDGSFSLRDLIDEAIRRSK